MLEELGNDHNQYSTGNTVKCYVVMFSHSSNRASGGNNVRLRCNVSLMQGSVNVIPTKNISAIHYLID